MVTKTRSKVGRQRGKRWHGWGAKKKHRGSGNKGGTGNAGSGKRADSKKPSFWAIKDYFGMHGFKKKGRKVVQYAINVDDLPIIAKRMGSTTFNLDTLGYNKLLSKGIPTVAYNVSVSYASQAAIDKIAEKGGSVTVLKEKKVKVKKVDSKKSK